MILILKERIMHYLLQTNPYGGYSYQEADEDHVMHFMRTYQLTTGKYYYQAVAITYDKVNFPLLSVFESKYVSVPVEYISFDIN